ncbi:STAS domain-containing protein [Ktedonobacter racemifer]|uniref:Anti-sigma-factor antagonist n=1 Tax=Ktedonobacter racemifer DSM 44963 TaxID=485913 RepID=D6TZ92_KTERA|nr:STAS domain-containing protein [Ktedonobacter racemifer]EFH81882.1 anti-sigma-factor antagonist [Ktedonobacter racemifer DSM 44963]
MPEAKATMQARTVNGIAGIIDIQGELNAFAEGILMEMYNTVSAPNIRAIILNFSEMEYMNSSGIGLIVTLLIRANRQKQQLFGYGLSEHYQNIFQLTRLNDSIQLYANENEAIKALRSVVTVTENRPRFFKRRETR